MSVRNRFSVKAHAWQFAVLGVLLTAGMQRAQTPPASGDVTFAKDIAPVLQSKCQRCHQPNGVAPMSLVTYEVRPWAKAISARTKIGPHAGVMPPWFMEKDIGIQPGRTRRGLRRSSFRTRLRAANG